VVLNYKEKKMKCILFSAAWCQPCNVLKPIYDRVAASMDDVEFVKVDIDDDPELSVQYGIKSVPTMVFEKDGKVMDTMVGLVTEQNLRDRVEGHK
jgi:thioredoxin 1